MLGVGWTEMLLIGVVALIVIGPKELPAVMQKIGKFAGSIRKMGQDFQRELNKTTGLNEVKNLRASITAPLKATTDAIRKEFNATTASGAVAPSGALKPADPKAESVVDEIHAAAGMKTPPLTAAAAMKAAVAKSVESAPTPAAAPVATKSANKKPATKAKAAVSKAKAPVKAAATNAATPTAAKAKAPAKQPAKPKATPAPKADVAPKPVDSPAPVEAIAPVKKPAARKTVAKSADSGEVPAKPRAKRAPAAGKTN